MIIDARTKEECDNSHIFSAVSIPKKDFGKSMNLLPKDKGVLLIIYCNSMESGKSRQWVEKAKTTGYTNITIYSEGFPAWRDKNMPIAPLRNGL